MLSLTQPYQMPRWELQLRRESCLRPAFSPAILSINTWTINKDVKQMLQFAFIILIQEKNPVNFFFTSEALFTIQTQSSL